MRWCYRIALECYIMRYSYMWYSHRVSCIEIYPWRLMCWNIVLDNFGKSQYRKDMYWDMVVEYCVLRYSTRVLCAPLLYYNDICWDILLEYYVLRYSTSVLRVEIYCYNIMCWDTLLEWHVLRYIATMSCGEIYCWNVMCWDILLECYVLISISKDARYLWYQQTVGC